MAPRLLSLFLCFLLVALPVLGQTETPETLSVSEDLEEFRQQLLQFLHEADVALIQALQDPDIAQRLAPELAASPFAVPFPDEIFQVVELATYEELAPLRDAVATTPAILSSPAALSQASQLLQSPEVQAATQAGCQDPYAERAAIEATRDVIRNVGTAADAVALAGSISETVANVIHVFLEVCETPFDIPTSAGVIVFVVIARALKLVDMALSFHADELEFRVLKSERCIDICVGQGFSERFRPDESPTLFGRGCDNRDNDCINGIDEPAEDMAEPFFAVDAALTTRCFPDPQSAKRAVDLAVTAGDDCYAVDTTISDIFFVDSCTGSFSATAEEMTTGGKTAILDRAPGLTIDGNAPTIDSVDLAACYPDLATASSDYLNRLGALNAVTDDCTPRASLEVDLDAVEKECFADLRLQAQDQCGNRSTKTVTARVDDTPPEVKIETLLLPSVDGQYCFTSEAEARAVIAESARVSDNCTALADLQVTTTATPGPSGGSVCDRTVTVAASDLCGTAAPSFCQTCTTSDSVVARIDTTPPTVMCQVEDELLWPPDDREEPVGFTYSVNDGCSGSNLDVQFLVTSDESTSFNVKQGEPDPGPDAFILRGRNNEVVDIVLRAQRAQTPNTDGRVYRIRVIATDECGLSSHADCYVVVPYTYRENSGVGDVVNSGQFFDATTMN